LKAVWKCIFKVLSGKAHTLKDNGDLILNQPPMESFHYDS